MKTTTTETEFGVNVWWTAPEMMVDASRAQEIVVKHGFEKSDFPVPTDLNVVSRAAHSFHDRRHSDDRKVTELTKRDANSVSYGILNQTREGAEEVAFRQKTTIRFDRGANRVTADGLLAKEFLDAHERYKGKVTDSDVRHFLRRVVRMCFGIPKRPTGGIYFIPAKFVSVIESAKAVLDEMGMGARLFVERVVDGLVERQNVWSSVVGEIEERIAEVMKYVNGIESRVSAIQGQEAKLVELKELMRVYTDLLGEEAQHEEITGKLDEAVTVIAAKMTAIQNAGSVAVKKNGGHRGQHTKAGIALLKVLKASNEPICVKNIYAALQREGLDAAAIKTEMNAIYYAISNGIIRRVGKGKYVAA